MRIFHDRDCGLSITQGEKVAIVGYNSQGHAHTRDLRDSDVDVTTDLRSGSAIVAKAEAHGPEVADVRTAVAAADVVMTLTPDEFQGRLYKEEIEPDLKKGAIPVFAHGFSIHYNQIVPRTDLDVITIVPKAPGHTVRSELVKGGSVPGLIVIYQDTSGGTENVTLSYTCGVGGDRTGIAETTFKGEIEANLFGEQAVLCGGCVGLVRAGFETLIEAGCVPEMAYLECLHELKLITDLMYGGGIANMNYSISNNAEYGEYVAGSEVINAESRAVTCNVLKRVRDNEYAKMFITEGAANYPSTTAYRRNNTAHPIEQIGEKLRAIMPWIAANKIVDKNKN